MTITKQIIVPPTVSAGASVDMEGMARGRTAIYVGTGSVVLESGVPSGEWATAQSFPGTRNVPFEDDGTVYRARRTSAGAGVLWVMALPAADENQIEGPPALGHLSRGGSVSTVDATETPIFTYTPGADGAYSMLVHYLALSTLDGQGANQVWRLLFTQIAGVVAVVGTNSEISEEDDATFAPPGIGYNINGATIEVTVTGIALTDIDHYAEAVILRALTPGP
jgi:hypothetical protein